MTKTAWLWALTSLPRFRKADSDQNVPARPLPPWPGHAHIFTFADEHTDGMCYLAQSVEAAGGLLEVLGLDDSQDGFLPLPGVPLQDEASWTGPVADKGVFLKKHLFLARALETVPANATVIFVDAFDTLFQLPISKLVDAFEHMASNAEVGSGGEWPVVISGERNCWPFPHNGTIPFSVAGAHAGRLAHEIPADAALSGDHHGHWQFLLPASASRADVSTSIRGHDVCGELLGRMRTPSGCERTLGMGDEFKPPLYPFPCSGLLVGKAAPLRRLLRRLFALYIETGEYYDQAFLQILLPRDPSLGLVDSSARLFLNLHGFDDSDLERPLCRGSYFQRRDPHKLRDSGSPSVPLDHLRAPRLRRAHTTLDGSSCRQPQWRGGGDLAVAPPAVLHFNGNGKRHQGRCVQEFRAMGLFGGRGFDETACRYLNGNGVLEKMVIRPRGPGE